MATVFKRGKKRWYARIKIAGSWKIIRLPLTWSGANAVTEDKAICFAVDAELFANNMSEGDVRESETQRLLDNLHRLTGYSSIKKISTSEFIQEWMKKTTHEIAENTRRLRVIYTNLFLDYLGDKAELPLTKTFTDSIARGFMLHLEELKYKRATIALVAAIMNTCALAAITEGRLHKSPFLNKHFKRMGEKSEGRGVFSINQATALIDHARNTNQDMYLLLSVMLTTGMRVGDAMSLTGDNFDVVAEEIRYTPEKQRKGFERELIVPIVPRLMRVIKALKLKFKSGETIYLQDMGPSYARDWFYRLKSKDSDMLDKNHSPHSCRHTFISMLANAGVSEEIRMRIVGHSSGRSKVHAMYTHISLQAMKDELQKVDWLK